MFLILSSVERLTKRKVHLWRPPEIPKIARNSFSLLLFPFFFSLSLLQTQCRGRLGNITSLWGRRERKRVKERGDALAFREDKTAGSNECDWYEEDKDTAEDSDEEILQHASIEPTQLQGPTVRLSLLSLTLRKLSNECAWYEEDENTAGWGLRREDTVPFRNRSGNSMKGPEILRFSEFFLSPLESRSTYWAHN